MKKILKLLVNSKILIIISSIVKIVFPRADRSNKITIIIIKEMNTTIYNPIIIIKDKFVVDSANAKYLNTLSRIKN